MKGTTEEVDLENMQRNNNRDSRRGCKIHTMEKDQEDGLGMVGWQRRTELGRGFARRRPAAEEEWPEDGPDLLVAPMLRENVRGVQFTRNVGELHNARGNSFADSVIREGGMALVEARVGNGGTADNGFVVSKEVGVANGNSHVAKSVAQVEDLLCSSLGSTKF